MVAFIVLTAPAHTTSVGGRGHQRKGIGTLATSARRIAVGGILLLSGTIVLHYLLEADHLVELLFGDFARADGVDVGLDDVGGDIEILRRISRTAGETKAEDSQIVELHLLTIEHQLAGADHHILKYTVDGALGERCVVGTHVLGQLVHGDGFVVKSTGIIFALGQIVVVLVKFVLEIRHNKKQFKR